MTTYYTPGETVAFSYTLMTGETPATLVSGALQPAAFSAPAISLTDATGTATVADLTVTESAGVLSASWAIPTDAVTPQAAFTVTCTFPLADGTGRTVSTLITLGTAPAVTGTVAAPAVAHTLDVYDGRMDPGALLNPFSPVRIAAAATRVGIRWHFPLVVDDLTLVSTCASALAAGWWQYTSGPAVPLGTGVSLLPDAYDSRCAVLPVRGLPAGLYLMGVTLTAPTGGVLRSSNVLVQLG